MLVSTTTKTFVGLLSDFVKKLGYWEGTATELEAALQARSSKLPLDWPASPKELAERLRDSEGELTDFGITVKRERKEHQRTIILQVRTEDEHPKRDPIVKAYQQGHRSGYEEGLKAGSRARQKAAAETSRRATPDIGRLTALIQAFTGATPSQEVLDAVVGWWPTDEPELVLPTATATPEEIRVADNELLLKVWTNALNNDFIMAEHYLEQIQTNGARRKAQQCIDEATHS